ncbi:DASH family cryptochrome [Haloarchaeobius baliensis]|uniref:DASH family cryptochrome n=1 Tax=Haloarchaeobius baliensis TaxID=1670458 RepID=UPI003F8838A0
MTSTAIVRFRRDLRLHDNPTLVAASEADRLLPVFVVDPRRVGEREYGGPDSFRYQRLGGHRARFLRESLGDLRDRLRGHGSDLLVRRGHPEDVLPELASEVGADAVHEQTLPTTEERQTGAAVGDALAAEDVARRTHWTHTLHHPDDLPVQPTVIDDTFTPFRRRVEAESEVREPVGVPDLPPLPDDAPDAGELPDPLGSAPEQSADERGVLPLHGGETRALERVEEYVWTGDHLREYRETRNGLVGADYSAKFSPWLAAGCLSPRFVADEVDRYEAERVANDSTYWLLFELRWRDFFQFQFLKHGGQQFRREGIRNRTDIDWRWDERVFQRWAAGETGVPFVDAAMRELAATGYTSNRARQNAASLLANDLRLDWRRGAAHFETLLVDYDPASNYGNWAYIAGVGNDSRDRAFDVLSQGERYDPDAGFVARWCPELADLAAVDPGYTREPWTAPSGALVDAGVELGVDYPRPIPALGDRYDAMS